MEWRHTEGISLRDYFAAAALQGLLAADEHSTIASVAKLAYTAADEMLEVRERQALVPKRAE